METSPRQCTSCGGPMPEVGTFCPACGTPAGRPRPVLGKTGGIPDRIAGALAYLFVIPAIVFLLREPFKRNRFIRFHAWQSILVTVVTLILFSALLPVMGLALVILVSTILAMGCFILWLVLMIKALQGETFELPLLGRLAERQADAH
jgi:uncharacterized membrane protein